MASAQFSGQNGTSDRAPDELIIVLNTKVAEECEEHRALTKKLMDDTRMSVQSQLDDMRRTFQEMFDEHSRNSARLMEEQRTASEQRLQGVLQTCERMEGQVEQALSEERAAVQGALQSIAKALERERAQRQAELQRLAGSSWDGPPAPAELQRLAENGPPTGGPPSAEAVVGREEPGARPDADLEALEARVAQIERLARAAESPDAAGGGPGAAPPAGAGDGSELVVAEGANGSSGVLAAGGEVSLGESMWDAVAFIGCSEAGACASLFTALVLSVTIFIQIVFVTVINDNLTPAHFTQQTVEDYELWRTTVAHNVKFVDDLSYTSLARKVCTFKEAPMSAGPIEGFASITEYLGMREGDKEYLDDPPLSRWLDLLSDIPGLDSKSESIWTSPGVLLCNMALVVWLINVSKEVVSIARVAHAFSLLPSGKTTISDSSDGLALLAVSGLRRGMFYGVMFVRSLVCLALAVCGAFYLAATISLGDLLLNAVALDVVISLPELVFRVFAPSSIRALISLLAPLPRPPVPAWRGLDARPFVAFLAIGASVIVVWWRQLVPQYNTLVEARAVLCDGDLDFIATSDAAGLVVAYSPANELQSPYEFATSLYEYRAVREIILNGVPDADAIWFEGAMADTVEGYAGSQYTVQARADGDTQAMTHNVNPGCVDLDANGSVFWPVFSDIIDSAGKLMGYNHGTLTNCSVLIDACQLDTSISVRARQYCPVTCGCDDPASELSLFAPQHGCPQTCVNTLSATWALGDMNCTDWTPEAPRTLYGVDLLEAYLDGLYQTGWHKDLLDEPVDAMNTSLRNDGCPGFVALMHTHHWMSIGDLCKSDNPYGLRPITAICPISCGCQSTGEVLCPTTC